MTAQYARWLLGGKRFLRFLAAPLRMLAAFLLGWLAGFWNFFGQSWGFDVLVLVLFGTGFVNTLLVGERYWYRLSLALLTGWLFLTGWCAYMLPSAEHSDMLRAACADGTLPAPDNCAQYYHGPITSDVNLLVAIWIGGTLIIFIGALIGVPIAALVRKLSRR
ncbi:MAG: hypothetical protein H0V70_05155 [Ktedonobacteraceae bacterium]|nr:hypothetical protein [Ktedonobacteraceae bacterium]